jgi:hypothetical protein
MQHRYLINVRRLQCGTTIEREPDVAPSFGTENRKVPAATRHARDRPELAPLIPVASSISQGKLEEPAALLGQSFIGTVAVLFGETDVGATSLDRGGRSLSGSPAWRCSGAPVSVARGGSGGGEPLRPWLNQSAMSETAVNCGTWAWAETQANGRKNRENVVALATVARTILFAPQQHAAASVIGNKATLRRMGV